jgi:hypothetical protein
MPVFFETCDPEGTPVEINNLGLIGRGLISLSEIRDDVD